MEGGVFQQVLEHPFLVGLLEGTLPLASFRHYIIQDLLYLRYGWHTFDGLSCRA